MDYSNLNLDVNRLISLGFTKEEISAFNYIICNGGKLTTTEMQNYGMTYEQAKRLRYMYNICAGRVTIDSKQELQKHLRKMFGQDYRITLQDLSESRITNIPRVAVVANIVDEPYNIWNSKNYKGLGKLYKVIDVSGQRITVETPRKPKLEYGKPKELPGILEIKGVRNNGNAVVAFDKKYCRLCNRFIIVASLRNPEFHIGKYEIVCFEGTKVYVYATNMGVGEKVKYRQGAQRVYDFGINPSEIKSKLTNVAKVLYKNLHGVSIELQTPNQEFTLIPVERREEYDEDEVEM